MLQTLSTVRRNTVPYIAPIVVRLNDELGRNIYVSYPQGRHEYVGVVNLSQRELEAELRDIGFELNPLAAWKTLANTDESEQGSWRWVNPNDEYYGLEAPSEATEYEHDNGYAHQLHVILYELDDDAGTTVVCAHHELAWDAYPIGHYRGHYYNPAMGERMFTAMCGDNSIPLDTTVSVDSLIGK